jgi:ribonuclease Y
MPVPLIASIAAAAMLTLGLVAGYFYQVWLSGTRAHALAQRIEQELKEAEAQQRALIENANRSARESRSAGERELNERRREIQQTEQRIQQRGDRLEARAEALENRDREFQAREETLATERQKLERDSQAQQEARQEHVRALEGVASLTREEAREALLRSIEQEVSADADQRVRQIEAEAKERAEARARWLVGLAIQRVAASHTTEVTTSVVDLKNDEMKGRIIGREGRNIRALEAATGVDIIIDDTPETVVLSTFDPVRREVARVALHRLIEDGRIHPARIEETVSKAKSEVTEIIAQEGERAAFDANITALPPEILRYMGRLRFRHSYGQNVLSHSVEVSLLAATITSEVGGDVELARVAGFVHDIGKGIDHEVEGPHALIGGELLRRHAVSDDVAHAAEAHHFEVELRSFEAFAVAAADAISGSRPGARRETVTRYLQRLEKLEEIANSFDGVKSCYAIQAGRELRVMVRPDSIDELGVHRLSREIADRIQENLEYPGQIKITTIRETRAVEYAK